MPNENSKLKSTSMRLSVVTPSFNQGQYIEQTLQSILDQKLGDLELEYIILDAKSTDQTDQIIKKYLPKLKKAGVIVKYISKKDKGQSDAINKGWKMSTGEIITYINSDDYFAKNIFNVVMRYFKTHPKVMWAYGGWNLVNSAGEIYSTYQPNNFSYKRLLNYCNIGQPSCFFRREILNECGDLDIRQHLAMDYDLWLRFAQKYPAGIIKKVLSNMRYHAEAKTGSMAKETLRAVLELSQRYSKPLSWRRAAQHYYFWRGLTVTSLGFDITRRIERKNRHASLGGARQ